MAISISHIRNIGILASFDAGKTTVAERLQLVAADGSPREQLPDSTETQAFSAEQREKGVAIATAGLSWGWRNHEINLVDTPGDVRLVFEMERALRVVDGVVFVLAADTGVESEAADLWSFAQQHRVPSVVFVNRMDTRGADFWNVVAQLNQSLDANAVAFEVPLWEQGVFVGIVDLVQMQAYQYEGFTRIQVPIPTMMMDFVVRKRQEMIEALSEFDDDLCQKCLAQESVFPEEIHAAARKAVAQMRMVPVLAGAASRNNGVQLLLDAIVDYLPSPEDTGTVVGIGLDAAKSTTRRTPSPEEPFSALCFKVIHEPSLGRLSFLRVFSGSLQPGQMVMDSTIRTTEKVKTVYRMTVGERQVLDYATPGDVVAVEGLRLSGAGHTISAPDSPILLEDLEVPPAIVRTHVKPLAAPSDEVVLQALRRLALEDPATNVGTYDPVSHQVTVAATSESRLQSSIQRLSDEFSIPFDSTPFEPCFRETISGEATSSYRYEAETANGLEFAEVRLAVHSIPLGPLDFRVDAISPDSPLFAFVAAVRRGVEDAMASGPLLGHRIAGVRVDFLGGEARGIDSNDTAFRLAAQQAFRSAFEKAEPYLVEPYVSMEFACPDEHLPLLIDQLKTRQGIVLSNRRFRKGSQKVEAELPLRTIVGHSANQQMFVGGRANYSVEFLEFRPMIRSN